MFRAKGQIAAVALFCGLCGCQRPAPAPSDVSAAAEAGYVAPPAVTAAAFGAEGVRLNGQGPPGAPIRLASPDGRVMTTTADAQGRWRIQFAPAGDAQIFGLSTRTEGRQIQAEGYLLVGPHGEAALLRAGGGAMRLDNPARAGVAALDFDGEGVGLVSGWAAAGTDVALHLDGRPLSETRADETGRFTTALPRLTAGSHRIEAAGVGFATAFAFDATPAAPLVGGPLHSQFTPAGLRADWLTPGGGVQSTLLAG